MEGSTYYIVHASAMPSVLIKVAEANRLLSTGEARTVNEAVEMTKRHKRSKASGLVNAVLRSLARGRSALPQPDKRDAAA